MSSRLKLLYNQLLHKHPVLTQAVQVSVLMSGSDVIAQCGVEKVPFSEINWRRNVQFASLGFFFVGPVLRIWYGKMDKVLDVNQAPWKRAVKKVALDQLAFAPFFTGTFTVLLSAVQGMKSEQIVDRLKTDYITVMISSYKLWPAAQTINFLLIPLNFQVVFAQVVAIIWNTYLSFTLGNVNKGQQGDQVQKSS